MSSKFESIVLPKEVLNWEQDPKADLNWQIEILNQAAQKGWDINVADGFLFLSKNFTDQFFPALQLKLRQFPSSDLEVFEQIFLSLNYQPLVDAHIVLGNPSDSFVLDIGSNIGLFALWFRTNFPRSRIHAFECCPVNFQLLESNLDANQSSLTVCTQQAVWSCNELLTLDKNFRDGREWARRVGRGCSSSIPSVALRELLNGKDKIDILKIDVEGAEFEIFNDPLSIEACANTVRVLGLEIHEEVGSKEELKSSLSRYFDLQEKGELTYGINRQLC